MVNRHLVLPCPGPNPSHPNHILPRLPHVRKWHHPSPSGQARRLQVFWVFPSQTTLMPQQVLLALPSGVPRNPATSPHPIHCHPLACFHHSPPFNSSPGNRSENVRVQTPVLRQCFHLQTKPIPSLPGIFQASSCLSSFIFTPHPRHSCYPSLTRCLAVPITPRAHSCPLLPSLCMWLLQSMSGGFSVTTSDGLVREDLTRKPAHHSWSTPSTSLFFLAELVFWKLTHKSTSSTQAGVCLLAHPHQGAQLCV